MHLGRSTRAIGACCTFAALHGSLPLTSAALAEERVAMPLGALLCTAIEATLEHARLVRQPSNAGLREYVEAQVASGACRVVRSEVTVRVVEIDQRGFARIQEHDQDGGWWTDAENLWGYFDTPAKIKAWRPL